MLALREARTSHEDIGATVTRKLRPEKGIEDTISRPAMTWWLKKMDVARGQALGEIQAEYVREHVWEFTAVVTAEGKLRWVE